MKIKLKKLFRTGLFLGSLVAAALVLGSSVETAKGASADPSVGGSFTWDFQSGGSGQRGIAVITFSNDQTFHGFQMWASTPPSTNGSANARGGSTLGRGGSSNPSGQTNNFVFGFSPINGYWTMNLKKQIVGFFSVALNVTSEVTNYHATTIFQTITNAQTFETTNILVSFAEGQPDVVTNFAWANPAGFIQTYTIDNPNITTSIASAQETNSISFVGTSAFARRLTLICSTSFGKVVYQGIPSPAAADLTGAWIGTKRENGQLFNEFFNLTSFAAAGNPFPTDLPDITSFPNIYFTTNGVGPGYTYVGIAMVCHGKVGFTFTESGNADGGMRSSIGSIKVKKSSITSTTSGVEEPLTRIGFDASLF